jgi:hypothetical protein
VAENVQLPLNRAGGTTTNKATDAAHARYRELARITSSRASRLGCTNT